jgi:hypothetical protein
VTVPHDDAARVRTLLTLYRESNYDAMQTDGSTLRLRVGELPSPALRAWMGEAEFGAYFTACNPHSHPLSMERNAQRLDALLRDLDQASARVLRGDGYMPGARWREPSVLVAGLPLASIDALLRRYQQNAALIARHAGSVRLRVYRDDWRALAVPAPDLEWA